MISAAVLDPSTQSERALVATVVQQLTGEILCLGDRGSVSFDRWGPRRPRARDRV